MFYIIGDIHGQFRKLEKLMGVVCPHLTNDDTLIFLGDYIDRGPDSFEVIEYLSLMSGTFKRCFLCGNHEDMFLKYYRTGSGHDIFLHNGGGQTISSYIKNTGAMKLPEHHEIFFNNLELYYEGDDFIAVHAGLNPINHIMKNQKRDDLIWIREEFYLANHRWEKTIIFGHTPTSLLGRPDNIYYDSKRNIIGIDTCAMKDRFPLTCLRWPDMELFQAYE